MCVCLIGNPQPRIAQGLLTDTGLIVSHIRVGQSATVHICTILPTSRQQVIPEKQVWSDTFWTRSHKY